jgi:hypothetical protein
MTTMTRQHFEIIAKTIGSYYYLNPHIRPEGFECLINSFIHTLKTTNNNFDERRFRTAAWKATTEVFP